MTYGLNTFYLNITQVIKLISGWTLIEGNNCWSECGGGACQACLDIAPNAVSGYCCSGINHAIGPNNNADCPIGAIEAQTWVGHSCVVLMREGEFYCREKGYFLIGHLLN